ncbi:uncharacterized protein KQ657_003818 [Scheffersomyces spartinae]|uniref:Pirin n=1 Tax=Scheffersomyces spartinae TaxID=45513 RepID=A0A9P7VCE4_9ASCO|nr:uncharacterized protein KQ657_003818 [Scheffersomyces spartinae]KAG7195292.1 hypothetical protein KQ657_003818 [Scheffersomyces spartinae]
MTEQIRKIELIVTAREQDEGVGARVRRSIGTQARRNFYPFLLFDHFSGNNANGFPEHPHRGQETITLMINGAMAHEDFTGSKGVLYSGDLQFMTAGKGVVHSEMPLPAADGSANEGLQLWVDLPNNLKNSEPRYRDLREWEIPQLVEDDGKVIVKLISGKSHGVESVKDLAYTPVDYYQYTVKKGGSFKQELRKDFNYFLYVLQGDGLKVNGDRNVKQFQNAFFVKQGDYFTGENNDDKDVVFALIGGKIEDQEVIQYGPFVCSSREGVEQAFDDYQSMKNGFENLRTWKTLISHGVTQEMVDGPLDGSLEKRAQQKEEYLRTHKVINKV